MRRFSKHSLVGIFFIFLVCLIPGYVSAASLLITSEQYPWWHNQWEPSGGDVWIGGSQWGRADGNRYEFDADAYAQGRMYCYYLDYSCQDHGAGGYRRWGWNVNLAVEGNPGEKAEVFLQWNWSGRAWVAESCSSHAPGSAAASTYYSLSAYLLRSPSGGQGPLLLNKSESWGIQVNNTDYPCTSHADGDVAKEYGPAYLGQMTVGDAFSITGEMQAYANAYVGGVGSSLTTQGRMDALFGLRVIARNSAAFNQVRVSHPEEIINAGVLIAANNLGWDAVPVTVNGIPFGNDHSGLTHFNLGWGDFYQPGKGPFDSALDPLLSTVVTQYPEQAYLWINGLIPGRYYRLQLLMSNDETGNYAGNEAVVQFGGVSYTLEPWKPDTANLMIEFWATQPDVYVVFPQNDGLDQHRAVLSAYALHDISPTFREVVISDPSDIINEGTLVAANNVGAGQATVRINGIDFGNDLAGLSNFAGSYGAWCHECGYLGYDLDHLLGTLVYQPSYPGSRLESSLELGGLTPGRYYRLQLLFSNDLNERGRNSTIIVDGTPYKFAGWQPDAVNLIVNFWATSDTVKVTFPPVTDGSASRSAILNGYALHESVPVSEDGDGIASDIDSLPYTFSNHFDDGTTAGSITDRGDQALTVTDVPGAEELGVVISADPSGGPRPATVKLCGAPSELLLAAGDQVVVTCGSVTIKTTGGTSPYGIKFRFVAPDGTVAVASLPLGNAMTFDPGNFTITAGEANFVPIPVELTVNGQQFAIVIEPEMKAVLNAGPSILLVKPDVLWPPNHEMVDVVMVAIAYDLLGDRLPLQVTISSNEPQSGTGSGDKAPDWTEPVIDQDSGTILFKLRAERSGRGEGRVYTINVTSTDSMGRTGLASAQVRVPHDKRTK